MTLRTLTLFAASLLILGYSGSGQAAINFSKKTVITHQTAGAELLHNPTSLAIGPDGRLYVSNQTGRIHAVTLNDDLSVQSVEVIESIYFTPNYNSDGSPATGQYGRLVLGMTFDPASTADKPVLYVTHSDPRIGYNDSEQAHAIDTHSGMLTKLTGPAFDNSGNRVDLVKGLPRSRENHGPAGLHWGPDGWLYFTVGSHTNNGAPSAFFSYLDEVYLTAAVLRANVKSGGFYPMDVRNVTGPGDEVSGLFEVFATGYRNAYDIAWHSNGNLYGVDNGANGGLGGTPGPGHGCPDAQAVSQPNQPDHMHIIHFGAFGGHPNPARGECVFDDGTAYSPNLPPDGGYTAPIVGLGSGGTSTNGIAEYTSGAFNGEMAGDLIAATYAGDENVRRFVLSPDGFSIEKVENLGAFVQPLDVAVSSDGVIFVAEHGGSAISALVPSTSGGCIVKGDPKVEDSDLDGYTNQDEIDNGTTICSQSSHPTDFDGDLLSDLNDVDDDNDGIPDNSDQFYFDASNGKDTPAALTFEWNPGDQPYRKVANTGFTGVQIASGGKRFNPDNVHVGAAGGFLSITTTQGTHVGADNRQENALQIAVNTTQPKRLHVRVTQPFFGGTPKGEQAGGVFLGTDEDNFLRLVVTANNGEGKPGIEFGAEVDGTYQHRFTFTQPALPLPGPNDVELILRVDPARRAVSAFYATGSAEETPIGALSVDDLPNIDRFFGESVAAGIVTTHAGTEDALTFGFDFFRIEPVVPGQEPSTDPGELGQEASVVGEAKTQSRDRESKWWEFSCSTGGASSHWPWMLILLMGALRSTRLSRRRVDEGSPLR